MKHMISARGILIGENDSILLVLEQITPGVDEFWVLPGGRIESEDGSLAECARREFCEETGLTVEVGSMLYMQEFSEPDNDMHHVGIIFLVHSPEGELHDSDPDIPLQGEELRRHVKWFTREELQAVRVYPETLREQFWIDRAASVIQLRHLGVTTNSN